MVCTLHKNACLILKYEVNRIQIRLPLLSTYFTKFKTLNENIMNHTNARLSFVCCLNFCLKI